MAKRNKNGLTDLQQAFCDAYLKQSFNDRTATGAYKVIRPKATQKTAEAESSRIMGIPSVAEYIDERTEKIIDDVEAKQLVTHADIVKELMHVGFSRLTDVIKVDEDGNVYPESTENWNEGSKASLKQLTMQTTEHGDGDDLFRTQKVVMQFHDKLNSLEKLMRYKNMFKEDQEAGSGGGLVILPGDVDEDTWAKQVQSQKQK